MRARGRYMFMTLLACGVLAGLMAGTVIAKQIEITWAKRPDSHSSMASSENYVEGVIQEFERLNPDIKVTFQPLTGDWMNKITTEMIAGTAPDVFEMWGDFAVNWGESGMLLDLRSHVKRDFSAEYVKGFYPGQWDASVLVSGARAGLRYGIPRYTNSGIVYYNADAFARAGLMNPHELEKGKEWTWETFLQSAKKVMRFQGDQVSVWGYQEHTWVSWVWSNEGTIFAYPENPTRFMLDQPKAIGGLNFLRSLTFDHQVMAPNRHQPNFAAGQVAMMGIGSGAGSCCIRLWEDRIKGQFAWNIAPVPVGPTGKRIAPVFLDMWGIYSQSKNPEAAWKLVKFLLSPYAQGIAARQAGEQPAHISGLRAYVEALKGLNVTYAVDMALTANVWPTAVVPRAKEVESLLGQAVNESVFSNRKSVEQAVAGIRPAIEALFQK